MTEQPRPLRASPEPPDQETEPSLSEESLASTEAPGVDPEIYTASQSTLVWRAFKKHKLAVAGAVITVLFYLIALFAEFLAPLKTDEFNEKFPYAPPQAIHFLDTRSGGVDLGLYVNGYLAEMDPKSLAMKYEVDESVKIPLRLFDRSEESYQMWGLFEGNLHLIGPVDDSQPMYLLGSDRNGRDLLSRIIYGTRVSMTIGLVGVLVAFVLGLTLGGISGYVGGKVDTVIQRLVEFFMSIPTLPLWLGLAAAVPPDWGPLKRYFAIVSILAMLGWTELARVTRGRFMSFREEEFVTSAVLDGNRAPRVIFKHLLPLFTSHLIASLTLSVPGMILAETALSFLGLGLQPPVVSWGVLLQESQNIRSVATAPWLMLPGAAVVIAVLSLNFVGDGLRDAADPYKQ